MYRFGDGLGRGPVTVGMQESKQRSRDVEVVTVGRSLLKMGPRDHAGSAQVKYDGLQCENDVAVGGVSRGP